MRTPPVITAVLAAALLTLGACSDDTSDDTATESASATPSASATSASASASESASATPKPSPAGTTIKVTISDGTVKPSGARVKAKKGEPITLQIDADTSGEIHVHSTPEQEIEFPEGKSTKKLTIDSPGIVDVEDHALEQVIVQLEVS